MTRMNEAELRERRKFVTHDAAGGVSVDIWAYLQSPLGRAHLRAFQRWQDSRSCKCNPQIERIRATQAEVASPATREPAGFIAAPEVSYAAIGGVMRGEPR